MFYKLLGIKRVRFCSFLIVTFLTCLLCSVSYYPLYFKVIWSPFRDTRESFYGGDFILNTQGCRIPRIDPFHPSVIEYYENISGDIPCTGKIYLSVVDNIVVPDHREIKTDFELEDLRDFNCTFRPILRNPNNITSRADNIIEYGEEGKLSFGNPLPTEFAKVICKVNGTDVYEEYLASTPIKPAVEKLRSEGSKLVKSEDSRLNVIVVGLDSVSKINFERHLKITSEYVRKNMSLYEFHGYMKVADNTFPNLTPMLTGHFVSHYYTKNNSDRYFDDLDFIWKNYSSIGYRTLLAEDAPGMATYNYVKNGFQYPPTDYFLRPFVLAIEKSTWKDESKVDCFQAKPEIISLFDYLRSFLKTMEFRPYFAFTWAARLTHGNVNKAGYADKPTFELLRDINDSGVLNRSMLIFMSDHGIRFGGIRKTYIGKIEERMPFLFISLPPWFLEAHPEIAETLRINQHRLVTPFDLYETLVGVYQMASGDYAQQPIPYGSSLFKAISPTRNCESAFILPHWCVCHEYKKISSSSVKAIRAAAALVDKINNMTESHRHLCFELELEKIYDIRVSEPRTEMLSYVELKYSGDEKSAQFGENAKFSQSVLLTISTKPGKAEFESTLQNTGDEYEVGDISRINAYGNHGDCVDNSEMRKYCYCSTN